MQMRDAIATVHQGQDLPEEVMRQLISNMLTGEAPHEEIGRLLLALRGKGESVSELVGASLAMRDHMVPIRSSRGEILDTCGTGGDGSGTFNISTAAAIVAAAAGATVAKHGNRKITSSTGSADVLSHLGVRIDAPREIVEQCLEEIGICFCFAPMLHPAMRHVAEVRKSLGVPTLFNLLGPLCNPAGAAYQVLGVGKSDLASKLASALAKLPVNRALVVRGHDGVDEVSLQTATEVHDISNFGAAPHCQYFTWQSSDFGIPAAPSDELCVTGPEQSAAVIKNILTGEKGACRDIVVINAAAALWVAGLEPDLQSAAVRAAQAIDDGTAKQTLDSLARLTNH